MKSALQHQLFYLYPQAASWPVIATFVNDDRRYETKTILTK
jgi:hypothetical protein